MPLRAAALVLSLAASFLFPFSVFAATNCLCTPPGKPQTCLSIDSTKLTGGARISGACSRLPSVVGATLNGWTCQPTPSGNDGLCAHPIDAFTAGTQVDTEAPIPAGANATDVPIVPQLNVPIPGLTFTDPQGSNNPLLAQYISAAYRYLITISAVVATIMFVWGAFQYLIGTALPSIASGKRIMQEAVIGMLLVFGAHLILTTVNPDTVRLKSLVVESITPYSDVEAPLPSGATIGNYQKPQAICKGEGCAIYCDECAIKKPLPSAPWIPSPNELTTIKASAGLVVAGGGRPQLRKEAADALARAGEVAQTLPGGPYTIRLSEAFRPLDQQLGAVCKKLCGATQKQFAAPGASLHGTGIAVDVQLWRGNKLLVAAQDPLSKQANIPAENARTLQQIMAKAGWIQYCPEIWHYEFGVPEGGEKSTHCPWPPPEPRK